MYFCYIIRIMSVLIQEAKRGRLPTEMIKKRGWKGEKELFCVFPGIGGRDCHGISNHKSFSSLNVLCVTNCFEWTGNRNSKNVKKVSWSIRNNFYGMIIISVWIDGLAVQALEWSMCDAKWRLFCHDYTMCNRLRWDKDELSESLKCSNPHLLQFSL